MNEPAPRSNQQGPDRAARTALPDAARQVERRAAVRALRV